MLQFQKGQSIVEFAVILPLFLLLVIGIINFGFLLTDYVSLNNVARTSAREASLASVGQENDLQKKYDAIAASYQASDPLPIRDVYDWEIAIVPDPDSKEKDARNKPVLVTIHFRISQENSIFFVFKNLLESGALPEEFEIRYYMYRENSS